MKLIALLDIGTSIEIPCVMWHDTYHSSSDRNNTIYPAGLCVRKSTISKIADRFNTTHSSEFSVDEFISMIECAEATFDILDDESNEPWRNSGNYVRTVHHGMNVDFWKNHA